MKKTVIWVLVAAVAVLVLGFGYTRLQSGRAVRAAMEELRNTLQTAEAERRDLEIVISGKGTVQPNEKKSVSSKVAGTVQDILAIEGDTVQAGQRLWCCKTIGKYQAEQARLDLSWRSRLWRTCWDRPAP